MSDSSPGMNNIVDKLASAELIEVNKVDELKSFDFKNSVKLPVITEILIGFGAFISTLFFCLFVGATSFMGWPAKVLFLFWSLIFMGAALGIHYFQKNLDKNNTVAYWRDISVCLMVAGKALFLGACLEMFKSQYNEINILLVASIFITIIIYPLYHNTVDRFLSIGTILIFIWVKILYSQIIFGYNPENYHSKLVQIHFNSNVFLLFHFAALGYLTYAKNIMSSMEPIRYAVLFSILLYFVVLTTKDFLLIYNLPTFKYFVSTLVVLSSCYVILELTNFKYQWLEQPVTNMLFLIVFLGLFLSPGIIFTLTLILYGYGHRDNKILVIGLLFFPFVLFQYYYLMQVTLLYKSLYLMLAGGLLILFSFYFQHYYAKGKQYVTN